MNYQNPKGKFEEEFQWPKGTPTVFKSCPICGSKTKPGTVLSRDPFIGWIKCTNERCSISYEARLEYNGVPVVTGKAKTASGVSTTTNRLLSQRHNLF